MAAAQRRSLQGDQGEAGPQVAHRGQLSQELENHPELTFYLLPLLLSGFVLPEPAFRTRQETASPPKRDGPFVPLFAGLQNVKDGF